MTRTPSPVAGRPQPGQYDGLDVDELRLIAAEAFAEDRDVFEAIRQHKRVSEA